MLSWLIVPGAVIFFSPFPWDTKKQGAIGVSVGILSAIIVPSQLFQPFTSTAADTTCEPAPDESRELVPLRQLDTTRSAKFQGGDQVQVTSYNHLWVGFLGSMPNWCNYSIDLDARLVGPAVELRPGVGWGYGVSVCANITNDRGHGGTLQYAYYVDPESGETGSQFSYANLFNPNTFTYSPEQYPDLLDNQWHHWRVIFSRGVAEFIIDDRVLLKAPLIGRFPLQPSCNNTELLVRAWHSTVQLKNVWVTRHTG
ncbi:hypothetical protein HII36_02480 [Nonomuraea sp. NN258]|uniref:hypothetical protein n=1 Tax=Nonomuraea antri TaxID=2730852 RepID=UPI001C2BB2C9|nr:hypothetical protein [Nonomuraea antri]NRQ30704.1 hypothetical protein [Nonomuraea antri]